MATVLVTGLIALFFAVRLPLLRVEAFNPDEFEHLHASYSLASGLVPYRDFFENHLPVLHFLLAPLVAAFAPERDGGRAEALILVCRGLMAGLSALTVLACYWLARLRSGRLQALAAAALLCGLSTFADKGFEIRPDVPALLFVTASWLALAAACDASHRSRRFLLLFGSGAGLSLATLSTQKVLFAWPAVGFILLWVLMFEARRERLGTVASWLAGLVLVIVAVAAWFAAHDAFAALVDQNVLLNLRWKTRYSPLPALDALWYENRATLLVSVAGLAMALRSAVTRMPRAADLLPVAAAVSMLAGSFIVPAPLDQYFLPLMPPLAWLAADALVALVRTSSSGRRAEWLLAGALLVLLFEPLLGLAQRLRSPGNQGRAALESVRWVVDNTETHDMVLDGFSGAGVFRPHAWFYSYPNEDIAPLIPDAEVAALMRRLRDGETTPRLAVLDRELRRVDAELLGFLKENYEPTGIGEIWRRRDEALDRPPFEGRLDVGAGPTDRLVGTGFYPPEREVDRWFRRSRGRSSALRVPVAGAEHSRLVLHLRLEHHALPVALVVKVNDRGIGRAPLEPGWRDYAFALPRDLLRPGLNRVGLAYTSTPRDVPGVGGRNAVIALDGLRIE